MEFCVLWSGREQCSRCRPGDHWGCWNWEIRQNKKLPMEPGFSLARQGLGDLGPARDLPC